MKELKTITVPDGLTYFCPAKVDEILIPKFVRHVKVEIEGSSLAVDDLKTFLLRKVPYSNEIKISGYNIHENEIIRLYIPYMGKMCSSYYDSKTRTMIFKGYL